jgi:hypothetical protein
MNSSRTTMKGIFRFGRRRTEIIEFNDQTTMLDVYCCIFNSFNDVLPSKFHVEFYSFETKQNIILDGNLLDSENNPFRFNSTNEEITNIADCEQFVIIDDSIHENHMHSQSSTYSFFFSSINH